MYGDGSSGRSYEANMTAAIRNYSAALIDAQKVEESSGGQDRTCVGGSSHGSTEVLYRLHASRFKVLLLAIRRANDERDFAELEAFRIASEAWFDDSNQSATTTGIRAKTWDVLAGMLFLSTISYWSMPFAKNFPLNSTLKHVVLIVTTSDTISALAQCRIDVPMFHRAAYRIAQAFNFAPAFHDPDCNFSRGSMQAVPATKSYRIRGLGTGSCAESAAVVITSLFEKRR